MIGKSISDNSHEVAFGRAGVLINETNHKRRQEITMPRHNEIKNKIKKLTKFTDKTYLQNTFIS